MKTITILLSFFFFIGWGYSQEVLLPMTHNTQLISPSNSLSKADGFTYNSKAGGNTIDSTFIYTVDTLTIPVFDDFSKNRIQQYDNDHNAPGVTSVLYYRLKDENDVVLPVNTVMTSQQTFRRTFDTNTSTASTTNFAGTTIKKGDLSAYPVAYTTITAYPPYYIFDTIGVPDVPDTVWIIGPDIVQDSARQFFAHAATPGTYWMDDNAYHNYRFAKDPWSIGIMTFDGIDSKGYPYQIGTTLSGYADYLTSKPIDMTGSVAGDSIYISFLYQKEGLGDIPEISGNSVDSLILEFYDVTAQTWRWQWSTKGGPVSEFKHVHIPITNPAYFTNAFQFRFKNYGGLSGALDHFHIDYVHLRDFSGIQDTLIEDFAVSYPTVSLLQDFTSVPWDHYKNNPNGKMSTAVPLTVRNSYFNGNNNITSAGGGRIDIKYGGVVEGSVNLNGQSIVNYHPVNQPIPDYQPRTTYHSTHDVSSYQFDASKTGTQQVFNIQTLVSVPVGSNYLPNDTTYSEQVFSNYYAYDDGSAEQAYGPQGIQSRLAIKYTPYEADSVIGAYIHFVPTVNNVTNKLFQLTIWKDNNGVPGDVIYEDNSLNLRQPSYGYGKNAFISYFTQDTMKVPVDGSFYIGWRQLDATALGVGLDRNTDQHDKTYYSLDGGVNWYQSEFPGSVMIRPIFSTSLDPELGVETLTKDGPELTIYPNPSNGEFHVQSSNGIVGEIYVYSMMGTLVLTTNETTFDLSQQPDGMYFVKTASDLSKMYKVVKTK